MQWDDIGYLISKNRYNENSLIVEFFSKYHGKCSGLIFGATSRKIKNYLQIKSPKYKFEKVKFDKNTLLCETSSTPKPFKPKSLRQSVLQAAHDFDHCGQKESLRRAKTTYFWPKLSKEVSKFVKTCHPCQVAKHSATVKPGIGTFTVRDFPPFILMLLALFQSLRATGTCSPAWTGPPGGWRRTRWRRPRRWSAVKHFYNGRRGLVFHAQQFPTMGILL